MKSVVLFSGGKDSVMALYKALEEGFEVLYLLTMIPQNKESYMFHVPNIHLAKLSAEAIDIPVLEIHTKGEKEEELTDLKNALAELKEKGIEAVFSGALFSKYQKSRIDDICNELNLKSFSPLWNIDEESYMKEIVDLSFEVIITGVSAYGLDESWLSKKIDKKTIDELLKLKDSYGLNIAFEGGEAETLVLDGPIFKKRIKITEAEKLWDIDNGVYLIKEAILQDKE